MASKNIQVKGSFDVSQILASFKQIRNEAEKSNISEKILGGYDKELEKVEKLTTQILAAQSRGLTDNQSIKEFARLVSQLEKQYGILNVKAQAFTDAANYKTETAEIKQYSTQLKTLIDRQKSLEKSARDYIDANSESLKLSKEESKALKQSISDAQAYKEVLDEIVEKRIEAAKAKVADKSLSTTGGAQKYAEITGQSANFTLSAADKKGRDSSRKSLVNKNGNFDEAKALAVANEEYNRILEESIAENKTAEEALEDMIKTMRAYKLELGDTDEVQKKFAQDMASIKDAAWENHGNLTDSDKGAYTRAGNNVTKIQNEAQGLYNNEDAGKAQQVAKEAEETSGRLAAAQHQYEQGIDNTIEKERELAATAGKTAKEQVDGYKNVEKEATKYVSVQNQIKNGFDSLGRGAKQILSVTTTWRSLKNVVKSTFNDIKGLDKAFANIAMVTSYSVKDLWGQYDQYAEMANKLGQSTQSVIEASGLYYQQGLKTNEVLKLTEETMKLATLAGLDFKEATSQMTAALRAFHMDMSEGAHVTDVYAEVAAHAAVDVQGLSEAMSATAAIANSAGMSFENTTAMLATMVEATQEAPKNLGTAMKTILARFTELKTNVAGTADSEFDDLDYNKVDKALKSVGVSIKDASGQFRNMDEVLLELSSKWKGLDRNSQRYIATIAAGSRQQSRFIALMENYERTMELVDVAQNSAGRSSQQFAKYQDTVEYRIKKIQNTWEQFRTNMLTSDFYKDLLDNFGDFLKKINDMSAGELATLATTWLTAGRRAISGTINSISGITSGIFTGDKAKEKFFEKNKNEDGYSMLHVGTGELVPNEEALEKGWEKEKAKALKKSSAIGTAIATSVTTAITTGLTMDSPWKAASTSMLSSLVPNLINGFQAMGPKGLLVGAGMSLASGAASWIISGIKQFNANQKAQTSEAKIKQAEQELERLKASIEQKQVEQKGNNEEIKNLKEIEKEYQEIGKKVYKTSEEKERFNTLVTNLQENYPELIKSYDEETGQLEIQNKLLEEKLAKTQEIQDTVNKGIVRDSFEETITKIDKANAQTDKNLNDRLKDSEYNRIDAISQPGMEYEGPTEKEIIALSRALDYDIDKIIEAIKDEGYNLSQSQEKSIREAIKDFNPEKADLSGVKDTARLYVDSSNNEQIKDATESAKDSMSIVLAKNYEKLANQLNLELDKQQYSNYKRNQKIDVFDEIIGTGSKDFQEQFSGWDFYATLGDLRENQSFEEYSDHQLEVLKEIGINSKEEYEEFFKTYTTDSERIRAFINRATSAAFGSSGLSEENINNIKALDEQLQNIFNSDKKIEEVEKEINVLRENYNFDGTQDIIDKYAKDKDDYKQFLTNSGLDNTDWANVSIKNIKIVKDNLEKYMQQFENTPEKGKEAAEKLYKALQGSGLSSKGVSALYDIDYTELSKLSFDDAAQKIAEKLEAADPIYKNVGIVYAKNILKGLSDKGLVPFIRTNAEELANSIQKELTNKLDFTKTYKEILSKISTDLKELGHIDIFNLDEIKESITKLNLNPDDFLYTDQAGNFQINYDDLIEKAKQQVGTEEQFIAQKKQEQQLGIAQLKIEIADLKNAKDGLSLESRKLEIEKEITTQKWAQAEAAAIAENRAISQTDSILKAINVDTSKGVSKEQQDLIQAQIDAKEQQLKMLEEVDIEDAAKKEFQAILNQFDEYGRNFKEQIADLQKEKDKAYKDWIDKTKAIAEAQKNLAKAIETVAEKQKELKAVIEGTNWKSSVDGMYNYNTALDFLTKQTERAKKKLEKAGSIAEAKQNFQVYGQGLLDQKAQLTAQNQTYRTAYKNIGKVYNNDVAKLISGFEDKNKMKFNLADYLVFDEKTGTKINMNALQKAKMPEALKKWIESQGQKANEYLGKILDNEDKIDQINEEFLEQQRKARDEYISLQDQMIDVLREKYQKEIDDLQNKYDAMNEADNKYLESLQKNLDRQRKLRDQEKNWNDLTDKERKLSLMQRDTSGGNLADVKNLQNEIEDQRTQLLDNAVDQIIEKLTEFYELQKEARDAEVQYKQTLIDDVNLLKEATEALEKIQTSDDLVNWWKKNVTGIEGFSKEKLDKLTEDWDKLFNAKSQYVASIDEKMKKSITDANGHLRDVGDEAEKIVKTTSEGITDLAEKSLQEAGEEYKKAVKAAKDALQDAVDAVAKQKEALQAAIDAANEAKKAFDEIAAKYKEVLAEKEKKPETKTIYIYNNKQYTNSGTVSGVVARDAEHNEQKGNVTEKVVSREEYEKLYNEELYGKNKTKYVGAKDSGDTYLYENKNSFDQYNPYKDRGTADIGEKVKHGVLEYDEKTKKWKLIQAYLGENDKKYAEQYLKENAPSEYAKTEREKYFKNHLAFAQGGLVDYTGPAWVDGSRSRPEAFLSAEDTRRIGEAARILADLPILSQPVKEQIPTTTIGDTTIQIDVHVDSIANDYDLDEAMNKVEQRIVNAAKYAGSNVILKKH